MDGRGIRRISRAQRESAAARAEEEKQIPCRAHVAGRDLLIRQFYTEARSFRITGKVYFSSHALGITKELTPSGADFTMRLSGEVTKDFPIGEATYDITVAFSDGSRYTARYAGKLTVREKINEVVPDE